MNAARGDGGQQKQHVFPLQHEPGVVAEDELPLGAQVFTEKIDLPSGVDGAMVYLKGNHPGSGNEKEEEPWSPGFLRFPSA